MGEFTKKFKIVFFLLEFEWQQVLSSLQDSSQYSNPSLKYYSFDCLYSASYYQVL